jgi:5-formyltetrahydrofolate cyclo-ligase
VHDGLMQLTIYTPDSIITQWAHGEARIENPMWYEWPLNVCLVPGLVFDTHWYRIGHGYGYYDKFLDQHDCYCIGVWFHQTRILSIPSEQRDQKMDKIIH